MKIFKNIENIHALLEKVALESNLKKEYLLPKITKIQHFAKKANDKSFELIESLDDAIFEDKGTQIKQIYDVKIEQKLIADFHLKARNNAESIEIIFYKGFKAPKNIDGFNALFAEIVALQALERIILRDLESQKNLIYEKLKNIESPLKNDFSFCLAQSKNFVDSKDGAINFHIDGIDLSKKNVIALKENVKICSYHFATNGVAGKNLKGEFVIPSSKTSLPPSCGDGIDKHESRGIYEYFSAQNGFVIFEKNHFSFSNEISLQNVELRDNYNFLGDLDTKSKIIVSTGDEFEDALKSGVALKANQIIINGNLGANTSLEAHSIEITARTHKSTILKAKSAKINVLLGRLECDSAEVESLEGGSINAEHITLNRANGGEITANHIHINEAFSSNEISFSTKLIIDSMRGGDNKIIFTPLASRQNKQKIESLLKELESNQTTEQNLKKKETALVYQYNKFAQTARELKAQIEDNKAKNRATPDYVLNNYKAFLEIVNSLKAVKSEIATLGKERTIIINTIREYQQSVFSAEFLCKDGWLKYNDVIFELISPKVHQSKTIIKGIGKYQFDAQEKCIVHHKIFSNENDEAINNQGF